MQADLVKISNSEGELDRSSITSSLQLIIAKVDSSFEEEDAMALNLWKAMRDIIAGRNKGSSSKEASKSQLPLTLPTPPPPLVTTVGLLPIPNLKKKRKKQEVEEGEMVPQKEAKQQKTAKDKWASSVDSRENPSMVEVRQQQCTWAPQLELDNAAIPWNSSIKSSRKGIPPMLLKPQSSPSSCRKTWML